jgi:hypothetical protein
MGQEGALGRTGHSTSEGRATLLLGIGASAGLALAALGLLEAPNRGGDELPTEVVARVNGVEIRRGDYERLLAGLESDTRSPITHEARVHVLDRMIEEELLVQRAVDLGLVSVDRKVRANLTSSLIASVVAEAEQHEPSEDELRRFYAENQDFFTRPGRLRARQIFFRVGREGGEAAARERAEAARRRLSAGEAWEAVKAAAGDSEVSPLPDTLLPATKLREYVGPTALRSTLELEVGEVSAPIRSGTGVHLIQLVDREPARVPSFEEVDDQVRSDWRRRRGDEALRDYLDGLRDAAQVTVRADLN